MKTSVLCRSLNDLSLITYHLKTATCAYQPFKSTRFQSYGICQWTAWAHCGCAGGVDVTACADGESERPFSRVVSLSKKRLCSFLSKSC